MFYHFCSWFIETLKKHFKANKEFQSAYLTRGSSMFAGTKVKQVAFDGGNPGKWKATHFVLWAPEISMAAAMGFQVAQ